MADTTVTVNQGGGADYTVLQTAIDDSDVATGFYKVEIEDAVRYSENITAGGSTGTPTAANYLWITATDAAYHAGVVGDGALVHPTAAGHAITITEAYVRLEKLHVRISSASANSNECIRVNDNYADILIERCILDAHQRSRATVDGDCLYIDNDAAGIVTVYNTLMVDAARLWVNGDSNGTINLEFCTGYRSTVNEASANQQGGLYLPRGGANNPTVVVYNNATADTVQNDEWRQDGSPTTSGSHNASEDLTALGTSAVTGITPADEWNDPTNFDLTIKNSGSLFEGGTDRSGSKPDSRVDATIDIVGTTRPATPSIGAFEFVAGGVTGSVVQATETDSAQATTPARVVAFGQATETDTAQVITPASGATVVAVDQASETDSAQAMGHAFAVTVGQAVETDTAQPITKGASVVVVDQATETDTAQVVGIARAIEVGQAVETDIGRIVNAGRFIAVDQAVETDSAQVVSFSKGAEVGQAVETDTAQTIAVIASLGVGQAIEADTAQAIVPARVVVAAQVSETDTANVVAPAHAVAVEQPLETDTAGATTPAKRLDVGQVIEADTAQVISSLLGGGQIIVNQAVETDTALDIVPTSAATIGQAIETETALDMTPVRVHPVIVVQEMNTAQVVGVAKRLSADQAAEVDTALAVAAARAVVVGQATEADTSLAVDPIRGAVIVNVAIETDSAQPMTFQLRRLVGTAVETGIAGDMTSRKTRVVQAVLIGHAPSQLRWWVDEDGRVGRARYHVPVGMPPEVIQRLDEWDNGRGGRVLRVLDPITDGMSVDLGSIVDGAAIAGATFSAAQVARNATFSFTATIGATSDGLLLTLGTETAGGVTIGTIANPTRLAVAIGDAVAVEGTALPETGISGLIVLGLSMVEKRLKLWQNGVEVIDILFPGSTWQDEAAAGGFHRAQADYVNLLAPNAIGAGAADDVTLSGNLMYYDQQLPVSF